MNRPAGKPLHAGRVLVLGGARSGKSTYAESLLAGNDQVAYVAPWSSADDPDWVARVAAHQARRPSTWATVENADVAAVLRGEPASFLVDCFTTWLAAAMEDAGYWRDDPAASTRLEGRVDDLLAAYTASRHVVAVSNELGQGVVPASESGRAFRDQMGWLNQKLAAASDAVWFVTAGIATRLK